LLKDCDLSVFKKRKVFLTRQLMIWLTLGQSLMQNHPRTVLL